ncbi:MAG: tagaturonate reductase [Defluviitaleaceae bacterium]|nr:tagaturonate reductase [Defluviitaleaceae bacterium]
MSASLNSQASKLNRGFLKGEPIFLKEKGIGFHNRETLPEKVLQFGEGNFLRAFVDFFIDELNEKDLFGGSIAVVQPIAQGMVDMLNAQDGCYTVVLRGLEDNKPVTSKRIVTSISRGINPYASFDAYMDTMKNPDLRFIVSNTTEAGITYLETDKLEDRPPASFPGKVTALLFERYKLFNGDKSKGFIFLPCELIDNSGDNLKAIVQRHAQNWGLPQDFINWVTEVNYFANILVDRIVTGYPRDEIAAFEAELGYKDDLLVTGEIFHFFAIEAPTAALKEMEEVMPFHKAGQNVVLSDDITPYKLRKVRILNSSHTMSVLGAFLSGKETVGEMMADPLFVKYLRQGIYKEIIPTINLDEENLNSFAASVFDRFANPHIKHYLLSIALNSVSKFKARVLPTILDYHKETGSLPDVLTFGFAALLAFYNGDEMRDGALIGYNDEFEEYKIQDSPEILEFFMTQWQPWQKNSASETALDVLEPIVKAICANTSLWDMDLNHVPGFTNKVTGYLKSIFTEGVKITIEKILAE